VLLRVGPEACFNPNPNPNPRFLQSSVVCLEESVVCVYFSILSSLPDLYRILIQEKDSVHSCAAIESLTIS
jgi:hypothetical protein